MSLRKIYILAILLCSVWSVSRVNAQSLAEQAGMAYQKGDYAKAVELYEQSGEQVGTSAAYFYNLGNAYYKCGRYPDAILNYERSLLLDSDNADTRFNLEMAQARIADKIEPLGTFFLVLYFFVEKVVLRKIGFFAGLLAVLVAIGANHFASEQKARIIHRDSAIIFAPTITVKSSPSESGTDLFVLHEGTKVYLMDRVGEWSEIRLEDGNRGWIPTDKLEII